MPQWWIDYRQSPALRYIHDEILAGHSFADAMRLGKEAFEHDMLTTGMAWVVDSPALDQPTDHGQLVYYMRLGDAVKIGTSGKLAQRQAHINPQGVMAVEWGGHQLERKRHNEFVDLHIHGEWFRLREPLVGHIFDLRAAFEDAEGRTTEQWLELVGVRV
jgi:hypothetical protein